MPYHQQSLSTKRMVYVAQKPSEPTTLRKGAIFNADLGKPYDDGIEIRNTRPCIVWRHSDSPSLSMVIPITSNQSAMRFPFSVEIKRNPGNSLKCDSIALLTQLRAIDNRRLASNLGAISSKEKRQVNDFLIQYLDLEFPEE